MRSKRSPYGGWLVLALLVALTGCGGAASPTPRPTDEPAPTARVGSGAEATAEMEPSPVGTAPAETRGPSAEDPDPLPGVTLERELALILPSGQLALLGPEGRREVAGAVVEIAEGWPEERRGCGPDLTMAWSPDGHRLALPDGVRTFADDSAEAAFAPILSGYDYRWSRDGAQLAWRAALEEHVDGILVAGPDGDEPAIFEGGHWAYSGRVEWSPASDLVIAGRHTAVLAEGAEALLPPAWSLDEGWGLDGSWSPDGALFAWTAQGSGPASVMLWDGADERVLAELPGAGERPSDAPIQRILWLPDGSGLLVDVHWEGATQPGIWQLDLQGGARHLSEHKLCDLAPDGQRLLVYTAAGEMVVLGLESAEVEARLGPGLAAAWRPDKSGPAPQAPLASRSGTISRGAGSQGELVAELQTLLAGRGYDVGVADGIFGERTEAAVREFQEQSFLEADGIVGPRTWSALRAPGLSVLELQRRLNALGYDAGEPDGEFGERTEEALRAFQRRNGRADTGAMDSATTSLLRGPEALEAE